MVHHENDQGAASGNGPETPVWLDEPTPKESEAARVWLAKHGIQVVTPARSLAVRIGARHTRRSGGSRFFRVYLVLFVVAMSAYFSLQFLPGVDEAEMYEGALGVFVVLALQLAQWITIRRRERHLPTVSRPQSQSVRQVLGGWYLAAAVITFGGGVALAVAMYVTTSARTYAWSWLVLLGMSAVAGAVVLADVLRAPARGEDEGSLAVDAVLRREDAYLLPPASFAVLVLFNLLVDDRQPVQFTNWLALYAGLAVVAQVIGWLTHAHARRHLPPAYYGTER
ncbi:hypothetical protein [Amycolatopsis magusensis]|nr:hypothetical protein [Amycolatopsis magusensis]